MLKSIKLDLTFVNLEQSAKGGTRITRITIPELPPELPELIPAKRNNKFCLHYRIW